MLIFIRKKHLRMNREYKIGDFDANYPLLIYSDTAIKHGISNNPDSEQILKNMKKTCECIIDKVALELENNALKIQINSSYRNQRVNALVKGSTTSKHMSGAAIDMEISKTGRNNDKSKNNMKLYNTVLKLIKQGKIECGQVIYEFGDDSRPDWVHVSCVTDPKAEKNEILRIRTKGGSYEHFNLRDELKRSS